MFKNCLHTVTKLWVEIRIIILPLKESVGTQNMKTGHVFYALMGGNVACLCVVCTYVPALSLLLTVMWVQTYMHVVYGGMQCWGTKVLLA